MVSSLLLTICSSMLPTAQCSFLTPHSLGLKVAGIHEQPDQVCGQLFIIALKPMILVTAPTPIIGCDIDYSSIMPFNAIVMSLILLTANKRHSCCSVCPLASPVSLYVWCLGTHGDMKPGSYPQGVFVHIHIAFVLGGRSRAPPQDDVVGRHMFFGVCAFAHIIYYTYICTYHLYHNESLVSFLKHKDG
jgi:hypothetical protein